MKILLWDPDKEIVEWSDTAPFYVNGKQHDVSVDYLCYRWDVMILEMLCVLLKG